MEVVEDDSAVEQEDGLAVVPLVGSVVGLEDEREAVWSVSEEQVLEVAVSEVLVQAASAWGRYDLVLWVVYPTAEVVSLRGIYGLTMSSGSTGKDSTYKDQIQQVSASVFHQQRGHLVEEDHPLRCQLGDLLRLLHRPNLGHPCLLHLCCPQPQEHCDHWSALS